MSEGPISSLKQFPTTLERAEMEGYLATGCKGAHESLLRSFQVLQKVKHLLEINTPAEVILEIIQEAGE